MPGSICGRLRRLLEVQENKVEWTAKRDCEWPIYYPHFSTFPCHTKRTWFGCNAGWGGAWKYSSLWAACSSWTWYSTMLGFMIIAHTWGYLSRQYAELELQHYVLGLLFAIARSRANLLKSTPEELARSWLARYGDPQTFNQLRSLCSSFVEARIREDAEPMGQTYLQRY